MKKQVQKGDGVAPKTGPVPSDARLSPRSSETDGLASPHLRAPNAPSRERPILFSGPMVRAILEGRKTQTRRIMNPQPPVYLQPPHREFRPVAGTELWGAFAVASNAAAVRSQDTILCPFGKPGDRLWVRETWATVIESDGLNPANILPTVPLMYAVESKALDGIGDTIHPACRGRWRPSIHMPRWASRITLEVVGVRVERLQDISGDDCLSEGIQWDVPEHLAEQGVKEYRPPLDRSGMTKNTAYVDKYRELWESINGPGSWDANPWVWVIGFHRVSDGSGAEGGSSERSEENGTREQRGPNEERETPNPTR